MYAVRGREADAEIAAVAALPARPGVGPQPCQRRGRKGQAEEQQRGARGEADHHADAVDLELPHAGDPDAQADQDQREHGEQPPALEPVLACRHRPAPLPRADAQCNHQLHSIGTRGQPCNRCLHSRAGDARRTHAPTPPSLPPQNHAAGRPGRSPQNPITMATFGASWSKRRCNWSRRAGRMPSASARRRAAPACRRGRRSGIFRAAMR